MTTRRIYAGHELRALRDRLGISQAAMAARIGLSVSYLSQIESGHRPLTPRVLAALSSEAPAHWAPLDPNDDRRLFAEALDAAADPSVPAEPIDEATLRRATQQQPRLARRLVATHQALLRAQEQLRILDDQLDSRANATDHLPWNAVRDWFNDASNYVDAIDRRAEALAARIADGDPATAIAARLRADHGIATEYVNAPDLVRAFDPDARVLRIDGGQPPETIRFALADRYMRLAATDLVAEIVDSAEIGSDSGRQLLAAGLFNYAAGALLMPYEAFRAAARAMRHDIDRLRRRFGTSFEQTCHRLSTLQRPGALGIPFFFCRVDMAGNITKRHSATRLKFARFGGACPLWIVHEAVAIPDRILVQLAETPDGVRYISIARGLVKPTEDYGRLPRRYALALGCEASFAADFVYADGLRIDGAATPIGTSCRICTRRDCEQRAFPPAAGRIVVDQDRRGAVSYELE
ncbi:short-chain fatty acyl-CoA regulator family protein [Sphingomonas sp. H39-1-10]|uniref:helix-turn-helix domain-containing protein n=1 Tax=Sphingomonas pollutisoli TaxID=3030829 RepID=UPI0023B95422|nr:XRE family transcriptional regulator [Sphingomonas pollutisoli]MDF0489865.1 short-chain fatty acyl-CoA regulator family protein [Sphingomonas pollutisoli]